MSVTHRPASVEACAALVRESADARRGLRIVGAGTWLDAGHPVQADDLLSVEAFRGMNIVTPTVHDGRVFTTSYGGGSFLFAVDAANTQKPVEQVWRNKIQGYMSTPIVIGGHAYVHLRNQRFACLDLATGKEAWITKPFGRYWSMVAQGDRILALDETGEVRLIRATPERFELLGEAKVATEESWAHLAIEGQELYVRDLEGLSAYRWK